MRRHFLPSLLLLALVASLTGHRAPVRAASAGAAPPFPAITALAATGDGAPVYVSDPRGLFRSESPPFSSWTRRATLSALAPGASAIAAISPNPAQPDDLVFSIGSSVFRSTDAGKSATHVADVASTTRLARARSSPSTLYNAGNGDMGGQIAKSTDDGVTWTTVYTTPEVSPGISSVNDLAIDPTNAAHVFAAEGLYHAGALIESRDGGATWHDLPDPPDTALEQPDLLAIDPTNPSSIWADWSLMGTGQLWHSADGGHSWQQVSPASPPYAVATGIGFDAPHHRVYVSVADETSGGATRIYWTGGNGAHFTRFAPNATVGRQVVVLGSAGILLTGDSGTALAIFRLRADGSAGAQITPAITGITVATPPEAIFAGAQNGYLSVLDARSGSYLWGVHTGGAVSSPLVYGSTVYAGSFDGNLYAVDTQTGSVRWRFATGGAVSAPALANGIIYIGSRDRNVYAVDARSGMPRWRVTTGGEAAAPTVSGTTVYVRSSDHYLYALDGGTGAVRWRFSTGDAFSGSPVQVAAGMVYTETAAGTLSAIDAGTGKVRWRYSAPSGGGGPLPSLTAGTVATGVLYAGASSGAVIALDAATGAVRWRYATGGPVQSAPAAASGMVYAGSWDHYLYALDARTGALRWRFKGTSAVYTSPRMKLNDVFISFGDGHLYALDARTGRLHWLTSAGATYTVPAVRTPADPAPPGPAGARYVPQTGHNLSGPFLAFWQRYGGLSVFGYPLTEPFTENGQQVQYTERFALALAHGAVVTLPLGRTLTAGRRFAPVKPFRSTNTRLYFPSTGHSLSGRFLTFWRAHSGSTLLGAPISEVIVEGNGDGSGRRYPLQWFERGRLEYHPELAGTRYAVELGLLGRQELRARGWL